MNRIGPGATVAGLRLERPGRAAVAVAVRPALWPALLRLAWRSAERRGHRLPRRVVPPPAYLGFRAEAMLGAGPRRMRTEEVIAYLAWCRRMRAAEKPRQPGGWPG